MIEPIIQLSILAPGEEKYIELVLKVSSQAIWLGDKGMETEW